MSNPEVPQDLIDAMGQIEDNARENVIEDFISRVVASTPSIEDSTEES